MNAHPVPLHDEAAGLYIHIPFCDGKCRYCAFYSEPVADHDATALVAALMAELGHYRGVSSIRTAYLGGGTPTCLPLELLARIVEAVATRWPNLEEFTVECNPGQIDANKLTMLGGNGVNRLSFGVQSFHPRELSLLGRHHRVEEAVRAIRLAQTMGFDNVGLDLIFAIPGSTLASWDYSLRSAVALGLQHVSAYSLSFEPGTPLDVARKSGRIQAVDEQTDRAMYELAIDLLGAAGLAQYEISNFARDGFACLHNQGYWQNRPYIGIGPAAGSYWRSKRTVNVPRVDEYVHRIATGQDPAQHCELIDRTDRICETAVLNLRTLDGINLSTFRQRTGADFLKVFNQPLRRYERQGLIEMTGDRVHLTREALAVADSVICDFAAL